MVKKSTKEKILFAARKQFVEHGFAGASIGSIAKLAEVNHSLIFHHFHNKEQLWVAVKESIVAEASMQNKTLPDVHLTFDNFLKELFEQNTKFYRNNPDIVRMINWQRLEHNAAHKIGITHSREMDEWINAFKHYQNRGDVDPNLKPEFIITLILGVISSAALDPNVFLASEESQQEYMQFCLRLLRFQS